MCMSNVEFALNWDEEEKDFVGIGYKLIGKETLKKYSKDKWTLASGRRCHTQFYPTELEVANDRKLYFPGFHIFLEKKDAANYNFSILDRVLIEVKYKNVVSYGKNVSNKYTINQNRPCIVSKYMKLSKVFTKKTLESLRA